MDRQHLTDDLIAGLAFAADSDSRYEVNDASVENLAVRVGSKRKSFVLVARFGGPAGNTSRRTLGRFPAMTTEAARAAAHGWNAQIDKGVDPAIEVAAARRLEALRLRSTFASVMEDYLAYIPSRKRSLHAKEDIAFIRRNILDPARNPWLHKPVSQVTDRDVANLVAAILERGAPTQALHCFKHLKRFFAWAMVPTRKTEIGLERNPIESLKAEQLELHQNVRDRVFDYEETRAYLLAAAATPYPYGPCLRTLIETGQRIGVVSGMRWSQINLARKLWIIPSSRRPSATPGKTSKVGGDLPVPLSDRMIELLLSIQAAQPAGHGDFVFSTTNGQKSIDNFGKLRVAKSGGPPTEGDDTAKGRFERLMREALEALAPGAEREPWVWHDVRRTVRTHLEPITGREEVAEAAIGHGKKGVVRVYNLYKYRPEIRRGFNAWSELLRKVEQGTCSIADWEHDDEAEIDGRAR